jgi:tRNA (mo5U34)-methyltransferase
MHHNDVLEREPAAPELQQQIEALGPWFHNLHLPGGVQTLPHHFLGGDFPRFKWLQISVALPADLRGWRVLDVGCNAGFYSFELARRGASVLAIDFDPRYLAQARWAAQQLDPEGRIEFRQMGVYEVAQLQEKFDLVWFMGVFYHLRYPLLALDLIWEHAAADLMLFQTMQRGAETEDPVGADYDFFQQDHFDSPGYPKMHFIEHRYSGDPTNWWAPNVAGSKAMLRSAGFEILQHPEPEVYLCRRVEKPADWYGPVYPAKGPEAAR